MQRHSTDPGTRRASLSAGANGHTLLVCPRCGGCGVSQPFTDTPGGLFAQRRFVCPGCGLLREWSGDQIERPSGELALDDYFHYPLWLQTPCRHGVVWAYNEAHLDMLAGWIESPLRSRRRDTATGWANGSFLSRLPAWMKSARNRREVAAAMARLRARCRAAEDASTTAR